MARKTSENKPGKSKAPLLSAVEFQAVLVWLDHEIVKTAKELSLWRDAAKRSRDPGTLGSVEYHAAALSALESARARCQQTWQQRASVEKLPPACQAVGTVLARNGLAL